MDVIIGAGVSGLSYANFTTNDYVILEKESVPGGYCRTIKKNDFIWDYSGHFFHFQNKDIEKFICKNIRKETLLKVEKHTQIHYKNNYIDFPFQKNIHQLEKDEFIDCLYDLYWAGKQNRTPASFKEMVYTKLGKSISEKFLIPYNEKLYACDLNLLDVNAMGRFFPQASFDDIIGNFRKTNNSSYNSHFTYPAGGAEQYVLSLLANLDPGKLFLDEEVQSIDLKQKLVITNRNRIRYGRLISTLPFPHLLNKCGIPYDSGIFTCNKVLVFNIGFDKESRDKTNSWIYFPDKSIIFYRVGYYNNILGGDRMSLYVEIGFPENFQLETEEVYLAQVLADLRKVGILTDQKIVDYSTVIMNPAYVHINPESENAVSLYKKQLREKNIYSIGRYGSWTYCSIEDNILEARALVDLIHNE